ncbi:hypothetical protein Peur_055617 [Populus x canadensis]
MDKGKPSLSVAIAAPLRQPVHAFRGQEGDKHDRPYGRLLRANFKRERSRVQHHGTFPVWAQRGESHSVHWSESVRRMIISKLCSSADYQHQGPFLLLHHPCALKCCSIIVIFIFYETFYTAYIR